VSAFGPWRHGFARAAIVSFVALVHSGILDPCFAFDDQQNITLNARMRLRLGGSWAGLALGSPLLPTQPVTYRVQRMTSGLSEVARRFGSGPAAPAGCTAPGPAR
jgi:hypothetical protein